MIDETLDRSRVSWVGGAKPGGDFPVQNLPLGIFSVDGDGRRPGVAIGDFILDLVAAADLLDDDWREDLSQPVLNSWLSRGLEDRPHSARGFRSCFLMKLSVTSSRCISSASRKQRCICPA